MPRGDLGLMVHWHLLLLVMLLLSLVMWDHASIVARLFQPLKVIYALLHHLMMVILLTRIVPLVLLLRRLLLFLEETLAFLPSVCFVQFGGGGLVVLLQVVGGGDVFALHAALEMGSACASFEERFGGYGGCRWLIGLGRL